MTSISYINPHFLAPSLLKPFKSSSRYQNLPGEPLTAHSDPKNHRKRPESTKSPPKIDLCWPLFPLWSYLRSFKSLFWPARSKDFEKLILFVLSTYFYLKGIDVSCPVNFQHEKSILYFLYKAILGPLKSCFDQPDQDFLKNDPICQINVFLFQGQCCFVKKDV